MSEKSIRKAVLLLLSDKKYKANCEIYSNSFKEAGGYILDFGQTAITEI
jgi:UDP:flavonoid glycosyltransferase YjiC (YdhE family)